MEATRAEKNRVIAEWLNILCQCEKDEFGYSRHGYGTATGRCYKCNGLPADLTPDFYASEEACALALEKMPYPRVYRDKAHGEQWFCEYDWRFFHSEAAHVDRKTAIAEAAYLCAVERKDGK